MIECNEIRGSVGKTQKIMQYKIELLSNCLPICRIKVINPFNTDDRPIVCTALIDTGADSSLISTSVFNKFQIDESKLTQFAIKNVNKEINDINLCPLILHVPENNWSKRQVKVGIVDLSDREYEVIIGIDILKEYRFYCDWIIGNAWLEY